MTDVLGDAPLNLSWRPCCFVPSHGLVSKSYSIDQWLLLIVSFVVDYSVMKSDQLAIFMPFFFFINISSSRSYHELVTNSFCPLFNYLFPRISYLEFKLMWPSPCIPFQATVTVNNHNACIFISLDHFQSRKRGVPVELEGKRTFYYCMAHYNFWLE